MGINWKVRLKNKTFWITAIPALLLVITSILKIFGIDVDLTSLNDQLIDVVFAVFALLAALGVVTDHTTEGFGDSEQALEYEIPKRITKEEK